MLSLSSTIIAMRGTVSILHAISMLLKILRKSHVLVPAISIGLMVLVADTLRLVLLLISIHRIALLMMRSALSLSSELLLVELLIRLFIL